MLLFLPCLLVNIVRKDIFQKQYKFTGSLTDEHYYDKPASHTALVQMILGGTNIQTQTENNHVVKTATLSISDILTFNDVKYSRRESISTHVQDTAEKEKLDSLYILGYFFTTKLENVIL